MTSYSGMNRAHRDGGRIEERLGPLSTCAVPMAVVEHSKRIAFAAYNDEDNTIRLEDFHLSGYDNFVAIERVVATMRPTLLLLPNKICSDELILDALRTPPHQPEDLTTDDAVPVLESIPYKLMKTSCFDVRTCKATILAMRVGTLIQHGATENHFPAGDAHSYKMSSFHSLATVIDFDNTAQVMAIGSLLSFLQSSMLSCTRGHGIFVDAIVHANVTQYMAVSADAFSALNIFSTEHHPLVAAKGSGNSKEGFSLFSVLDSTKSRAGRAKLREWMLKPLTNRDSILRRQDGVEMFLLPEMREPVHKILFCMKEIGVIDKIFVRIQKSCALYSDFTTLLKSISRAIDIAVILRDQVWKKWQQHGLNDTGDGHDEGLMLAHRAHCYIEFTERTLDRLRTESVNDLFNRISQVVDNEQTLESKVLVIRPRFDDRLDALKEAYEELYETMEIARASIEQSLPHLGPDFFVVYVPQVGFLVAMRPDLQEMVTDDFEFLFLENGMMYFKNAEVRGLDQEVGDLAVEIRDREAIIVAALEEDILHCNVDLSETFNTLAELDCILSFANVATLYNYVRPEVLPQDEHCIQIVNGRHPVQELEVEGSFIANDTRVDASNRVNIITGPNFSGKSCYARQVGVIVFMAQIGSFIPCEAARISIFDQILAHFSSVESCSVPQSSFQRDLTKMGSIVRRATPRSLVIVDEFGKGTSPASGIALLSAAIHHFSKAQSKVMCTTHFLELFSMGLIQDGEHGIKALRMAVQIPGTTEDSALPLFTLEEGVASSSAGIACARNAGVKVAVIERAHEVVEAVKNRRKVHPLMEILRRELDLNSNARITLTEFVETDWNRTSDADIDHFLSRIGQTRDQTF